MFKKSNMEIDEDFVTQELGLRITTLTKTSISPSPSSSPSISLSLSPSSSSPASSNSLSSVSVSPIRVKSTISKTKSAPGSKTIKKQKRELKKVDEEIKQGLEEAEKQHSPKKKNVKKVLFQKPANESRGRSKTTKINQYIDEDPEVKNRIAAITSTPRKSSGSKTPQ
jgi:hypothetical protein